MDKEFSAADLGLPWKGFPSEWKQIPSNIFNIYRQLSVLSPDYKRVKFKLYPLGDLMKGRFGIISSYLREDLSGNRKQIVVKRPQDKEINLLYEALFQAQVRKELEPYGLHLCIPEVYDIFQFWDGKAVWFSMEEIKPTHLLSSWCCKNLSKQTTKTFSLLLLQMALVLFILSEKFKIDHRDCKVNNILVLDEEFTITINLSESVKEVIHFPFRVVFIDFGFACYDDKISVRMKNLKAEKDDFCPKEGRDIWQVLISLWYIQEIRHILDDIFGNWFIEKIKSATRENFNPMEYLKRHAKIDWVYEASRDKEFSAPLCAPKLIIEECLSRLKTVK
jgi:hypothetical protein